MMGIRSVIVDDEPPARSRIRRLLERDPTIDIIAECGDGRSAVDVIRGQRPDLVFLDVEMPEMDGLEVVRQVGVEDMPVTIFATAHEHYAIRAFEVHALDYLLKPFNRARFAAALIRAKQQLAGNLNREAMRAVLAMVGGSAAQNPYCERLPVAQQGRIVFVNTAEIDCIEANGNYVRVHAGTSQYELRETLAGIEQKLNPREFVRIHRSTIVNLRSVKEVHSWFHGHHLVILKGGKEVRMSRYQRDVAKRLGIGES